MNDFGAGLERTIDYMNRTDGKVKVVLANVNCSGVFTQPELAFCNQWILEKGVHPLVKNMIGVVGFINPDVEVCLELTRIMFMHQHYMQLHKCV